MRWYWIDRFTEFHSGVKAQAVKCVSLGEDHMHDNYPMYPVMPHSLVVEGVAQTGGLLICEHYQYQRKVVLAKINKVAFHCLARPGDMLIYSAQIDRYDENGTSVSATSVKRLASGEECPHAEFELMFANLDHSYDGKELYRLIDYRNLMISLRLYDVGVQEDGVTPLQEPEIFKNLG